MKILKMPTIVTTESSAHLITQNQVNLLNIFISSKLIQNTKNDTLIHSYLLEVRLLPNFDTEKS